MWTRERMDTYVRELLGDRRLILVANREPYIHVFTPDGIRAVEPDSGVVSALDPVMRATGGTWVAHGSGSADRETADDRGRIKVPQGSEAYTLRRVWLNREEEEGYYYGVANQGLWPLCHIAYERPTFEKQSWKQYERVNEKFAEAVADEAGNDKCLVFVQDYHFALLPRYLRRLLPSAILCHFWHIPWPNPEVFRICPWKKEILEGLLGNDLLAFHIQYHCNNFLEAIDRELEARIDRERQSVTFQGKTTLIRAHPISVDFDGFTQLATSDETARRSEELRKQFALGDRRVLLSVGRIDYTKGIPERIRAYQRLLETHPEYRGKVVLLKIAIPSRSQIPSYSRHQHDVVTLIEEVNRTFGTPEWRPIVVTNEHQNRASLAAFFRLADTCLVTSLHDGMNLVAKEFVAARPDGQGALVLSSYTGAARELTDAVLVNPYAIDETAEGILSALEMSAAERESRMSRMRLVIQSHNVFRWAGKLLKEAVGISTPTPIGQTSHGTHGEIAREV